MSITVQNVDNFVEKSYKDFKIYGIIRLAVNTGEFL